MRGGLDPRYVLAQTVLLDALEASGDQVICTLQHGHNGDGPQQPRRGRSLGMIRGVESIEYTRRVGAA